MHLRTKAGTILAAVAAGITNTIAVAQEAGPMTPAMVVQEQKATNAAPTQWQGIPPHGCPLPPSPMFINGLRTTGRYAGYTKADTWYPSWAADGNLYSPFADGNAGKVGAMFLSHNTGQARITGDDPMALTFHDISAYVVHPQPHGGLYPCGSLVKNGVWLYGYYALNRLVGDKWMEQGPFIGFRVSRDFGKTWVEPPHTPAKPLFDEKKDEVRLGSPHFVDFGKEMEHSPDGKAYLLSHGTSRKPEGEAWRGQSWIIADQVFLSRVDPTPEAANDPKQWEFFAGHDAAGKPQWTHDLAASKPLIDWPHYCGCVTATWVPGLKRYIMCVTNGRQISGNYDTWFAEAEKLTGPWRMICYLRDFGTQAYFVNIPSKFIVGDGGRFWLCYSANFLGGSPNPPGSGYQMSLVETEWTYEGSPAFQDVATAEAMKNESSATTLTAALSHTHARVRMEAARRLVAVGVPAEAVALLQNLAGKDPSSAVRAEALKTLGMGVEQPGGKKLLEILQSATGYWGRADTAVCGILRNLGTAAEPVALAVLAGSDQKAKGALCAGILNRDVPQSEALRDALIAAQPFDIVIAETLSSWQADPAVTAFLTKLVENEKAFKLHKPAVQYLLRALPENQKNSMLVKAARAWNGQNNIATLLERGALDSIKTLVAETTDRIQAGIVYNLCETAGRSNKSDQRKFAAEMVILALQNPPADLQGLGGIVTAATFLGADAAPVLPVLKALKPEYMKDAAKSVTEAIAAIEAKVEAGKK